MTTDAEAGDRTSPEAGSRTPPEAGSPEPEAPPGREALVWPALAALVAIVPFAGLLSLDRIFHLRDLSLFFWERHLWLRRSLWAGEWPLWDPYAGGGQSAVADGLHQMFLLPALLARLAGTEVIGFNLWVALPFPMAALGAYAFFRARFSRPGSALGAIAFAVSGPVVSSGNFPNLSWSIAAMPWVLWAADRCAATGGARAVAVLATACACQVLAGEPVTMAATALTALAFAVAGVAPTGVARSFRLRQGSGGLAAALRAKAGRPANAVRPAAIRVALVAGGLLLGLATAAVQVLPMASAVADSWRPYSRMTDFWSFHPLGLLETVSPHLFGNYFDATLLAELPWMGAINSGRDPFFYSIYLGPVALALAAFGAVATPLRRWAWLWVVVAVAALVAAFGAFTPIYPFLQAHVPLVKSFRYPVKYLLVAVLAVASLVACGWDALAAGAAGGGPSGPAAVARRRFLSGLAAGVAPPSLLVASALAVIAWSTWDHNGLARWFYDLALRIGAADPVGCARFALNAVPRAAFRILALGMAVPVVLLVHWKQPDAARGTRHLLFVLLAGDLAVRAWGLNPTFDARLAQAPAWTSIVARHPETRFYMGGRGLYGTFVENDPHAATSFVRPFGMTPVEGRSAMAVQSVFHPSPWRVRELFSYDLAVLWPRPLLLAQARFLQAAPEERDRFLARTAARFRILPPAAAPGRTPLARLEYFQTLCLYDWGPGATRAFVVPYQAVVPAMNAQIDALFAPGLDARRTVVTAVSAGPAFGVPGAPGPESARIVEESANRVLVDATAGAGAGFLVLLDTFSPDWTVTVDGRPATIFRGNALFRTVPLAPGAHRVEFRYRPWSLQVGAALSLVGVLGILLLLRRK